jgi:hypothetical protein
MKAKKTLVVIMVCSLVFTFGTSAFAEDWGWYECTITKTGTGGSRFEVQLNGTKLSGASTASTIDAWFEFHPNVSSDISKVLIATILTAMSTGSKVEVLVIPGTTKSLYALYLLTN